MVLTNELRKEIENDIERCNIQTNVDGSETLYNELVAKYEVIDSQFSDGLPHHGKVAALGSEFDYRPGLKAIASKLSMWLKVWEKETPMPAGPEEKVKELIERGKEIGKEEFHPASPGYPFEFVSGPKYKVWMNEIAIFASRHLKEHPLFDSIISTFKTYERNHSAYKEMMGYLKAVYADREFFLESSTKEPMIEKLQIPIAVGNKVFIVHGHDNEAKQEVARTLEKADFLPIILHEQASSGKTIIEKIEANADVSFAVVLYTPCDLGRTKGQSVNEEQARARQNVVFEHGYLIGKLGRANVCALVKGDIEKPGDISGVVYVQMDSKGAWKFELAKEMKAVGLDVDANKFL